MRKIFLILFSILTILTVNINTIFAAFEVDGRPTDTNADSPKSTLPNRYDTYRYNSSDKNYLRGIRLSFVTNEGVDISTNDYVLDYYITNTGSYNITRFNPYYVTNGCSKAAYANNNCNLYWHKKDKNSFKDSLIALSSLVSIFNSHGFSVGDMIEEISSDVYDTSSFVSETWFKPTKDSYSGNNYQEDIRALLKEFVPESYLTDENISNLFLVVEPLSVVTLKGYHYYGTAYELAKVAKDTTGVTCVTKENGKCVKDEKGNYIDGVKYVDGTNALSYNLYNLLLYNVPCSGYLSGNIVSKMDAKQMKINGFSNTINGIVYFNNIKINTTICDDRLTESEATNFNGVGMTVVWFYEFIEPQLTCEVVNNAANFKGVAKCENVDNIVTIFNEKIKTDENYSKYSSITSSWYKKTCGCQAEIGFDCTPEYVVNNCNSTTGIYYRDSSNGVVNEEYWNKCVFNDEGTYSDMGIDHKYSSNSYKYTYLDSELGDSEYCPVYCIETLSANFDSSTVNVEAGTRFVWPQSANVTGGRTCRTSSVNWTKFESDLNNANNAIKTNYINWQLEILKENAINNAGAVKNPSLCGYKVNAGGITACLETETVKQLTGKTHDFECNVQVITLSDGTSKTVDTCLSQKKQNYDYDITELNKDETTSTTTYSYKGKEYRMVTRCKEYDYSYNNQYSSYTAKASFYLEGSGTSSWSKTWCETDATPTTDVSGKKQLYLSSLPIPLKHIERMQNCTNWSQEQIYKMAPSITITYDSDETYKIIEQPLEGSGVSYSPIGDNSTCEGEKEVFNYTCSDNSCTKNITKVLKCTEVNKNVIAKEKYGLSNNTFRYVLKDGIYQNYSINATDYASPLYKGLNYVDIGSGNLPVSYNSKDGLKNISLDYSNLGHVTKGNSETTIDGILKVNSLNYGDWDCKYNVYSSLIKPDDINVIYRTIDLVNPFPDIDGSGREVGSNWCDERDCSNDNALIQSVIKDTDMTEPMYSFTLTPSIIRQIRNYNKSYDENNNKRNYSDFNLKCEKETGRACVSSFVTDLINGNLNNKGFNANATGSCIDSMIRQSNSEYFYGC